MNRLLVAKKLVLLAKELMAAKPSSSEIKKLVEAYALKMESANAKAPMRIQQRFHDRFQKQWGRLSDKYPDVDMKSDTFWSKLEDKAKKWWQNRPTKGAGVDW